MNTIELSLDLKGKGDTQQKAVEDTFKNMRQELGATFEHPIISLRTVDYIVNKVDKTEKEEAYLFIFMKRKVVLWEIDVTIKVEVEYVNIEGGK